MEAPTTPLGSVRALTYPGLRPSIMPASLSTTWRAGVAVCSYILSLLATPRLSPVHFAAPKVLSPPPSNCIRCSAPSHLGLIQSYFIADTRQRQGKVYRPSTLFYCILVCIWLKLPSRCGISSWNSFEVPLLYAWNALLEVKMLRKVVTSK